MLKRRALREKIRTSTLSRHGALRVKKNANAAALTTTAKTAYLALEPSDLLNKHAWLFREGWVEEFADEIDETEDIEKIDFQKREEHTKELRIAALREIHGQLGLAGILEMAERGKTSSLIGWLAAGSLLSEDELQELLRRAHGSVRAGGQEAYSLKNLIVGAVRSIFDDQKRERLLKGVAAGLCEEDTARLLMLAPFRKSTWTLVDTLSAAARSTYWSEVVPDWIHESDAENNEGVERLSKAGRPRAAFSCLRFEPDKIDAQVLYRLLSEMAQGANDKTGEFMLEEYHVEKAFKYLNSSSSLTLDQKAGLEFAYLEVLARPWDHRAGYGIPNLEHYVEAHPEVFSPSSRLDIQAEGRCHGSSDSSSRRSG